MRGDIPPSLIQILDRLMAEDPAQRFQNTSDLAAALERVIKPEKIGDTPTFEASSASKKSTAAPEPPASQLKTTEKQAGSVRPSRTLAGGSRRSNRRQEPRKTPAAKARLSFLRRVIALLMRHRVISSIVIIAVLTPFLLPLMQSTPTGAPSQDGSASTTVTAPPIVADQKSAQAVEDTSATRPSVNSSVAASVRVPRILMLIPIKEFRRSDCAAFDALEEQGVIEFTTTSWSRTIMGNSPNEPTMSADLLLSDVVPDDFDALVIHGGRSLIELTNAGPLHNDAGRLIREMHDRGKLITGISAGPGVLASFQLLDGVAATANPAIHEDVRKRFGVTFSTEPVVRSGLFITAKDSASIPEFIRVLQAALEESSRSDSP